MLMAINLNNDRFSAAFKFLLNRDWRGNQKALAIDVNLSPGFISDLKNDKKTAGAETQAKIAEVMGFPNFDNFLALGNSLLETGLPFFENQSLEMLVQKNNVFPLIKKGRMKKDDPHHEKMHQHLDIILESGEVDLIEAIKSNLASFKRTVELARENAAMKNTMAEVLDRLKKVENSR